MSTENQQAQSEPSKDESESHPQTPLQEGVSRAEINAPETNRQDASRKFGG